MIVPYNKENIDRDNIFHFSHNEVYRGKAGSGSGYIKFPKKMPLLPGTVVEITNPGERYSSYRAMLLALGYKDEDWGDKYANIGNHTQDPLTKFDKGVIEKAAIHEDMCGYVFSVRCERNNKIYLLSSKSFDVISEPGFLEDMDFEI